MKITLHNLLAAAAEYYEEYGFIEEHNEIVHAANQWYGLLNVSLEDLHLSRLDLDGMEKDFISINGSRI